MKRLSLIIIVGALLLPNMLYAEPYNVEEKKLSDRLNSLEPKIPMDIPDTPFVQRVFPSKIVPPQTIIQNGMRLLDKAHLNEPLIQRKERLNDIVVDSPALTKTMYVDSQGKALFALTKEKMEVNVAKRKDSKYYLDTKTPDWLKIKHFKTIDVVILGYRIEPFGLLWV